MRMTRSALRKTLLCIAITVAIATASLPAAFASEVYLGKKNNRDYYFDTTFNVKKRVTVDVDKATPDIIKKFKNGEMVIKLTIGFAANSVPTAKAVKLSYEVLKSFADTDKVKINSKDKYYWVVQTNAAQRHFYTYTTKNKKAKQEVLVDEKGKFDVFATYEPVGTGYKKATYSKKIVRNCSIERRPYKNSIDLLRACARLKAHNGKEIWSVVPVLAAKWSKR